jgi:hypothetical protein
LIDLKAVCDAALSNPLYHPANGITYCNWAVDSIAQQFCCHEFDGLDADEIYQVMASNASGKWTKSDGSDAAIWALSNGLAIAGMPSQRMGQDHGHVAVLYPLGMQYSPSLNRDVPMLCNIGKSVGIMKSSEAFPIADGEAEYFMFQQNL